MAIPDYEMCMLPLLKAISDGQVHTMKSLTNELAQYFDLTEEERIKPLPSGQQTYIANRVAWAKTYLKMAGLLENPMRGKVRITSSGRTAIADSPAGLTREYLKQYPSFIEFTQQHKIAASGEVTPSPDDTSDHDATPDEAIDSAYWDIRHALADDLIEQVMNCTPTFFERLVLDLLVAMGYGGALPDSGSHLGKTGDGGIDGTIKEDKLGLDIICIQAKRWKDTVGRPYVQGFAGSMEAHRAKKGVMITTSNFSKEARDFVERIERRIVLIDGQQLAQLMIDYNVGVTAARTYVIKKIDSDYFVDVE